MKYLQKISLLVVLAVALLMPATQTHAQVTYTNTASLLAQIKVLQAQLAALEQQVLLRSTTVPAYIAPAYTIAPTYYNYSNANYSINRIEVSFSGSTAQVRVVFNNGATQFYAFQAYNTSDVAQLLASELNLSPATILGLITQVNNNYYSYNNDRYTYRYNNSSNYNYGYGYNNTDIRTIDVTFSGNDASVFVRFRNGATDNFTLNSVYGNENDVINRLADRYNMNTRDIGNVISFN